MTAETEAVGHHGVDAAFSGDVRDVVEVAAFTGVVEIDRRRKHAVVNRQRRDDQLDPARGTQRVAELALGAGNLQLRGMASERPASSPASRPGHQAACSCREH